MKKYLIIITIILALLVTLATGCDCDLEYEICALRYPEPKMYGETCNLGQAVDNGWISLENLQDFAPSGKHMDLDKKIVRQIQCTVAKQLNDDSYPYADFKPEDVKNVSCHGYYNGCYMMDYYIEGICGETYEPGDGIIYDGEQQKWTYHGITVTRNCTVYKPYE